jgi:prepilin-type N-terminal cleavage/methylation domain-containing protein
MRAQRKRGGFTLIELLITIVIVGILATIAMAMLWRSKDRSLIATLQGDLKVAAVHQETYFSKHYGYAPVPDSLTEFSASPGVTVTVTHRASDGWAGIAEHVSLTGQRCGLLVGAAPVGSADPALVSGVVTCGPF